MSVVIVGGHERMECRYQEICKKHGCEAKIFTREKGSFKKMIGSPDIIILFTNTVSHKMINNACQEAKRLNIPTIRIHSSSSAALHQALTTVI